MDIQLIPKVLSLNTDVSALNCFSFLDNKRVRDFFSFSEKSDLAFRYRINNNLSIGSEKARLQFSNLTYSDRQWFYGKKLGPISLTFRINEEEKLVEANDYYNRLFIKVGWLEPIGNVLTDYLTYELEKTGRTYHHGAAVSLKDHSFLFFGEGRNFKTTLAARLMEAGAYYIGEEFFLLENDLVYSTIPNRHRFDRRASHKLLEPFDLRRRKVDVSEYSNVFFLFYSNEDKISEISPAEANSYAKMFHHNFNTYYYDFFGMRDKILGNAVQPKHDLLANSDARFFTAFFTDVRNVFDFVERL